MLFSSPVFLFLFLPAVLLLYFVAGRRLRNGLLTLASLLFYAWGEPLRVLVLLVSVAMNYLFGLAVDKARESRAAMPVLTLAVAFNLSLLVYYKYALFLMEAANSVLAGLNLPEVAPSHNIVMPIGISFFTFQAMSYVIDVYRREGEVQRNPFTLALYITLFPQLIAGPIVRYVDVAAQLAQRQVTSQTFAEGVERFVFGLGKKMLIANAMAAVADVAFNLPAGQLSVEAAWLGLVCYAFQIYFDFSGYSDMAVGLGLMFGFRFVENFNFPYIARSITEFWRRWHISLSNWFRDYVYIPLGGNRRGPARTVVNLLIVFLLCGLWHGASWTFVLWGLFHGSFLVGERLLWGGLIARCWRPAQHAYTLFVVLMGWVLFRADTLPKALAYFEMLFGLAPLSASCATLETFADRGLWIALTAAVIGSMPTVPWLQRLSDELVSRSDVRSVYEAVWLPVLGLARVAAMLAVLIASASMMLAATYNPFIYFRF